MQLQQTEDHEVGQQGRPDDDKRAPAEVIPYLVVVNEVWGKQLVP
jgi:hypothetical protein